jgi:hypothetical protein
MLVVHELAHAFHDGVPFVFPRSWLMELFADMALYAFVTAEEPDQRLHFETLPRVALGRVRPFGRAARWRTRPPCPPGRRSLAGIVGRTGPMTIPSAIVTACAAALL